MAPTHDVPPPKGYACGEGGSMTHTNHLMTRYASGVVALAVCLALVPISVSSAQEPAKTDGVRTIYLIRHGEYDHTDERDPDVGKGLVPLGVAQARIVAWRLRGMPVEFTSLQSSTMTRAKQTALVIGEEFPDLELQTSRLISECTPPTRREDIMAKENMVDLEACTQQLDQAFAVYFTPSPDADRNDVIVCHGNVIRYFVTRVLGVDTMAWLGMSIGNCSLTVVQIRADGSMGLLSFSDVGHLPPNLSTRTASGKPIDLKVPGESAELHEGPPRME
jgi:serine/threonine-protein phosphatase PGAM5